MNDHLCNIHTVRAQELCEDTATMSYCLGAGMYVDLCISHAGQMMQIQYGDDRGTA